MFITFRFSSTHLYPFTHFSTSKLLLHHWMSIHRWDFLFICVFVCFISGAFLVLYGIALATAGWGVVASLEIYPPFAGAAVSAITLVVAYAFAISRPQLTLKVQWKLCQVVYWQIPFLFLNHECFQILSSGTDRLCLWFPNFLIGEILLSSW